MQLHISGNSDTSALQPFASSHTGILQTTNIKFHLFWRPVVPSDFLSNTPSSRSTPASCRPSQTSSRVLPIILLRSFAVVASFWFTIGLHRIIQTWRHPCQTAHPTPYQLGVQSSLISSLDVYFKYTTSCPINLYFSPLSGVAFFQKSLFFRAVTFHLVLWHNNPHQPCILMFDLRHHQRLTHFYSFSKPF